MIVVASLVPATGDLANSKAGVSVRVYIIAITSRETKSCPFSSEVVILAAILSISVFHANLPNKRLIQSRVGQEIPRALNGECSGS